MIKRDNLKTILRNALDFIANKHKTNYEMIWEISNKMTLRNTYHNFDRIVEVLNFLDYNQNTRGLGKAGGVIVPHQVMIALFLQSVIFNPYDPEAKDKSANYAKNILDYYAVSKMTNDDICNLILVTKRLCPPMSNESYATRLMYDLRNTRLAYDWNDFRRNMAKIRNVYKCLDNKDFFRLQFKLFTYFDRKEHIFSVAEFQRTIEKQAKINVNRYKTNVKTDYWEILQSDPEELNNFLGIKGIEKKKESKSLSGYEMYDLIKDEETKNIYQIQSLEANSVKVRILEQIDSKTLWGQIPLPTLYSNRFKKLEGQEKFTTNVPIRANANEC